jgi:hypothetical protein
MLQVMTDGTIQEVGGTSFGVWDGGSNALQVGNCFAFWPTQQTVYWNNYPVYVCTDKTKKAIEVLKALQAEKILKCESVPRFIALVEKISALL